MTTPTESPDVREVKEEVKETKPAKEEVKEAAKPVEETKEEEKKEPNPAALYQKSEENKEESFRRRR